VKYSRGQARDWVRSSLRDYLVVTTTPFSDDGEIDEEGLRRNVEHILRLPGTGGIYVNSIYQEFWTLRLDERKRVVEIILESVGGRVPVVVGTSHTSLKDALELTQHAEKAGADLAMIWPPYFGPRTEDGVFSFFAAIADRVDIGLCTYSSSLTEIGFEMSPEFVARVAEIPNMCAVKEASLSVDGYLRTVELVGKQLAVSSPLEEYWFIGMTALGGVNVPPFLLGSSRPLYMETPEHPHLADFLAAVHSGNLARAREILSLILHLADRLHNRYLKDGGHHVALTKYLSGLFGMAAGPVRAPLGAPTEHEKHEAREVLTAAGLLNS
jgi:4-hydroxy-tetrahydrodipicolinate synthase